MQQTQTRGKDGYKYRRFIKVIQLTQKLEKTKPKETVLRTPTHSHRRTRANNQHGKHWGINAQDNKGQTRNW